MKIIMKIFYLFLTVFPLMVTSCQKEPLESATELTINGEHKVITVEKNGVGIEFCLLNEQGQPATVFNEGEDFKFHLAIINNVEPDTAMYIVSHFLSNSGLFRVYSRNGHTIGQPAEWHGMDKISDGINQIKQGKEWVMEFPWHETRGTEVPYNADNDIRVLQHYFMGLNRQPLSNGKYYTKFTQQFCLARYYNYLDTPPGEMDPPTEYFCTDTLTLRINFEIK